MFSSALIHKDLSNVSRGTNAFEWGIKLSSIFKNQKHVERTIFKSYWLTVSIAKQDRSDFEQGRANSVQPSVSFLTGYTRGHNISLFVCRQLLRMVIYVAQIHVMADNLSKFVWPFRKDPFIVKMKHILLKSGKYLNNWRFCCDGGRYCHATQIEHLTNFELKPSILNRDMPQLL